jgi:hypothetical protein
MRMVAEYYGVVMEEEEIRSIALNGNTRNLRNEMCCGDTSVSQVLARLLLNTAHQYGKGAIASNVIPGIINNNRPIMAGIRGIRNNAGVSDTSMHMYVIRGYRNAGVGSSMEVIWIDPLDPYGPDSMIEYSHLIGGTDDVGVRRNWLEYLYMLTPPKAPKQIVVGKHARLKTVSEGLEDVERDGFIHLLDVGPYEEQVTLNSNNPGITIMPTPTFPRSVIKSGGDDGTLRVLNARAARVLDIDIYGGSAVYNTGSLSFLRVNATAESGYGIYNTGTFSINNGTISSASNYAVYNNGYATIENATVSSASDTAFYNTGDINIFGETILSASSESGVAIYNYDRYGSLYMGGNPTITGSIVGFGAGRMAVATAGSYAFRPGDKKYILAPSNFNSGDIVVMNGGRFIDNFELADTNFILIVKGNSLAINYAYHTVNFDLNGGSGTIPANVVVPYGGKLSAEQMPETADFARFGYINDGKWYTLSNSEYNEFVFGDDTPVTENITLYLKWTAVAVIATNTVSFNLNGGTGTVPGNIVVSSGSRLNIEQMPSTASFTKDGYINDGKWYTIGNNSRYTEFVFGENGTRVTSNTTLYLQWTNEPTTPDTTSTPGGRFTAGPNPVSQQAGVMNFFWEGEEIKNGMLSIYNSTGNLIRKINVNNDKISGNHSRRIICSWDLKDQSSRPVSAGSYLVVGTITTKNSKKESVSVMVSVR